ncbi:2587_t:CDS:2 [Funneliformis geosporum]|uniref:2587_t:CDS:1 n=1 Tax=Funneliformis geosporum TaxID=1117311 RepID=A0A9W4SRB4_9GLOM|nr:2587_t:CDS:2 [Funneliformis geosporum]
MYITDSLIQIKKSNILKSKSMLIEYKQNVQSDNKKRSRKSIVIDSDIKVKNEDNGKENKLILRFNKLKYWEKDLVLKEHELVLRESEAKIHIVELTNLEKEHQLKLTNTN